MGNYSHTNPRFQGIEKEGPRKLAYLLRTHLEDVGTPLPCHGPDAAKWTSDDLTEVEWAAQRCMTPTPCPLLPPCRSAGLRESWGAWGGHIATDQTRDAEARRVFHRNYRARVSQDPALVEPAATYLLGWLADHHGACTTDATQPRAGHLQASFRAALALLEARGLAQSKRIAQAVRWTLTDAGRAHLAPATPAPSRAERRARRRKLRAKVRELKHHRGGGSPSREPASP